MDGEEGQHDAYVLSVVVGGVTPPPEPPALFEQALKIVKTANASTADIISGAAPVSVKAKVFLFEFVIHVLLIMVSFNPWYNCTYYIILGRIRELSCKI